ncbi:MAG: hypothetical protein J6M66_02150 [Lachnospiraceae bacterium]|nr:hypothetical protein [Lachnospiraceae bacterium]
MKARVGMTGMRRMRKWIGSLSAWTGSLSMGKQNRKNTGGAFRCAVLVKRVVCAFLTAILVVTGFPVQFYEGFLELGKAEAADGTKVSMAYILETTTGINDGSEIEFFEIRYTDTDNVKRRQLIFPNEDSLMLGRQRVIQYGSDKDIADTMNAELKYAANNAWDKTGDGSGLRQYHTDQFYFTTKKAIKSVERIDAFMGGKGTWTCQGLRLFRVDEVYGLRMAGVWSETWYIDFAGELIAEVANGNLNWNEDAPNYLHMNQKAQLVTIFDGKSYAKHESQETREYGFRFDFADRYGAGFECLTNEYSEQKADLLHMGLAEIFTLNVTYTDVYGQARVVHLPMITGAAYWAYAHGISEPVLGLGQQGGSLALTGELPDCETITGITCTLGGKEAYEAGDFGGTSFSSNKALQSRRASRYENSESDSVRLICAAVYDMDQAEILPYLQGAILKYDINGKPILYQLATSAEGEGLSAAATTALGLKAYDDKDLVVLNNNEYFLIELSTDEMAIAGTESDLKMILRYKDLAGRDRESSEISVKEATREYYGYWPASVSDFGYKLGAATGNTLKFIISLRDVDHFTGMTLNLEENTKDDYQFKNLKIYALNKFSERKAVWRDLSAGGMNSHVEIFREFDGTAAMIKILDVEEQVLIQDGDVIPIDFTSSKVGELEDTKWDLNKNSVTYADAMQNFGFTKSRKKYDVTVNVFDDAVGMDDGGNIISNGGNGDAGSENIFYFQLIFQNGSSAYVQANQQLKGDRFNSGEPAEFSIITNQDYGEVTSIRIIPDDTSEDNKKFDKLRIDSIKVTESATAGTHKCWVAENVGWIGIGYTEEQEKQGVIGKKGRSASEIARTVSIDYTTYVAQLEFALHTNEGVQVFEDAQGNSVNTSGQYRGKLWAKINYINLRGERKSTKSFDVVQAMYDYMNKKPTTVSGGAVSDTATMFREKQTDRFLVNIDDASQLVSMDLDMTQLDDPYYWSIGSVSVKLVTDKGKLRLNAYGEYEYQRAEEPTLLCTQTSETTPAYRPYLKKNSVVKQNILFTENEIKIAHDYGTAVSAITREPASQNDELNVYVFPSIGQGGNDMSEYDLNCTLYYAHLNGSMYETGTGGMHKYIPSGDETGRPVFYALGLRASCMTDLNRIILSADADRATVAKMDYAIVQQVRSGVVVANYYINLENDNAFAFRPKFPSTNVTAIGYQDEQIVSIQFGETTESKNLVAERQDIAVALTYKTASDPSGQEFTTPYIYLTDQGINKIRAGQVVDLKFNQMFIGEVTGVKVAAVGDAESYIDAANVAVYQTDVAQTRTRVGFYSFGDGIAVGVAPITMSQTASTFDDVEAVRSVTLTFKTSAASDAYESGTQDPIWMRLYYATDDQGNMDWTDRNDIRKYLTDGNDNFLTGQTQSVRFLVKGASSLRRIEIEPRSVGGIGNAGWSVDTVTAQLDDGQPVTRTIGARIYEGDPRRVTLANITVAAQIYNFNPSRNANDTQRVQMDGAKLIAQPEREFTIVPYAYGSDRGCSVYAVEVNPEGYESGHLTSYMESSNGTYTFTPPRSTQTKYYRITVESDEVPTSKLDINLTVNGVEQETTNSTNTNNNSNSNTNTDSNSGNSSDSSSSSSGGSSDSSSSDSSDSGSGNTVSSGDAG